MDKKKPLKLHDQQKLMWYKKKVAGPYSDIKAEDIRKWIQLVDSGAMACLPDVEPMSQDMEDHPNEVHFLMSRRKCYSCARSSRKR